ncbi:MAG: hypothetical protein IJE23_02235 [Tyzzerella sp.]|nr:hypothetical protein [Tyzzerella sp.]
MQLLLKNTPVLEIKDDGTCTVLDFDRLPFALRKEKIAYSEFVEWAMNRTLSLGRSYAKEILNTLRLSQNNRYAIFKACRGLSLEDAYWVKQDGDTQTWEDVNLFYNPLTLFVTEVSLSGRNKQFKVDVDVKQNIHTPELTTLGASAKGWIRHEDGLYLHKVGKYELPACEILDALGIEHIPYRESTEDEVNLYLSIERKAWIQGVGEAIVNSKLFTSEDVALVTFEEFASFCAIYGLNPYDEARKINPEIYYKMQIADYILNNNDRHEQNWGFLMDNQTGKIVSFCPLFDHDHAFAGYDNIASQTTEEDMTLYEAAKAAQAELKMDIKVLFEMKCPKYLEQGQWEKLLERAKNL